MGTLFSRPYGNRPIIVIDPAGDAVDVGRSIVQGYERAQTLRFAHALKKSLLKKYEVYPVISRTSGEKILPLQIPSFSNRLGATFFLRIHMYREESEKPKLFFYHLLFDPFVDTAQRYFDPLNLVPLHQAHFANVHVSRLYGTKMYEYLNKKNFKRYFDCYQLLGIPLKNLIGITAPAILLEIGICREGKWKNLVEPIVDSLSFLTKKGFV